MLTLSVAVTSGLIALGCVLAAERSRAVAEAQCESEQPADQRGRCIALLNGDQVAAKVPVDAAPGNALFEQENAARAMTVSLVAGER